MTRKAGFLLVRAALRTLGVRPMPAVLIMGHMRCGSTLLLHILLSDPQCIGRGERNAPYRSTDDLDRLEIASRIAQRAPFRRGLAVDQINHDRFTPDPALLRDERVRCIFLVRDPRPTIQSIVNMTQTFYEPWSVEHAVDYYSRRLETLAAHAARLGSGNEPLALTYNDLVNHTPASLGRLESFLGLGAALREQYTIQAFTGKRGDPSDAIRTGRIVRERVEPSIEIPPRQFDRALDAYQSCMRTLQLGI